MRRVLVTAACTLLVTNAQAEQVWLVMDQVRPYVIERAAGQIVIGNPAIADITVQDKNRILLFGKAPGLTNLYFFDEAGEPIENLVVRVAASNAGMLTFYRGMQRTTYTCAKECDATITVGDSSASFGEVSEQVQAKQRQAASGSNN
jgi:Flp pilus assembly secretin CpaC